MKRGRMKKDFFKHHSECETKCHCGSACGGSVYFVGFIGAVIYYIQQANGFWEGVLGVLKALVWPAFLVYKMLSA